MPEGARDRAPSRPRRLPGIGAGVLSGLLGALSFPPYGQAWLAWIALVPLFLRVAASRGRGAGLPFFAFGAAYFTVGLSWLHPALTPAGPPLLALVLSGLYVWPAGLLTGLLLRGGWPLLLAAPAVWVGFDWVRSFLFTGFPWLFLAHSQAGWSTLVQAADLAGAWGLTFLVVLANAALVRSLLLLRGGRLRRALFPLAPAALLLLAALGYGAVRPGTVDTAEGPRVLLVQGNIPQWVKDDERSQSRNFARHAALMEDGVRRHPGVELVIGPETTFPYPFYEALPEGEAWYLRLQAEKLAEMARAAGGRPVLFGALCYLSDGAPRNSVFLLEAGGRLSRSRYDKLHAVPGGEYVPLRSLAPRSWVRAVGRLVEKYAGFTPNLVEGERPVVFSVGGLRYGPVICYEICFPALVRGALDAGADVIVNVTNYGWFPGTAEPEQANQIALFRAVENRRPVVVSANTGISAVISPLGRVEELSSRGRRKEVPGTLAARLVLSRSRPLQRRWGDAPAAALLLLAAAAGAGVLLGRGRKAALSGGPAGNRWGEEG